MKKSCNRYISVAVAHPRNIAPPLKSSHASTYFIEKEIIWLVRSYKVIHWLDYLCCRFEEGKTCLMQQMITIPIFKSSIFENNSYLQKITENHLYLYLRMIIINLIIKNHYCLGEVYVHLYLPLCD